MKQILAEWKKWVTKSRGKRDRELSIVTSFGCKSPRLLNSLTKAFIGWSYSSNKHTKMCKMVFSRYIFETWKASMPRLRQSNSKVLLANDFRTLALKTKVLASLGTFIKENRILNNCDAIYGQKVVMRAL